MRNPITKVEFQNKEDYIESLIESWKIAAKEKNYAEQDEKALVEELNKNNIEGNIKPFKLKGTNQEIRITPRTNTKYEYERGEAHPLKVLMGEFPELADKIRLGYSEKGTDIKKMLEAYHDEALSDPKTIELCQKILAVRKQAPGKPGVVINDRKDKRR